MPCHNRRQAPRIKFIQPVTKVTLAKAKPSVYKHRCPMGTGGAPALLYLLAPGAQDALYVVPGAMAPAMPEAGPPGAR